MECEFCRERNPTKESSLSKKREKITSQSNLGIIWIRLQACLITVFENYFLFLKIEKF